MAAITTSRRALHRQRVATRSPAPRTPVRGMVFAIPIGTLMWLGIISAVRSVLS